MTRKYFYKHINSKYIMNAKHLIIALLVGLSCALSASAADDNKGKQASGLSKSQSAALKYAQEILKKCNNTITLPIEMYAILGDTVKRTAPEAVALWDKAYFKKDPNWYVNLVIPLKAKTATGVFRSELYVRSNAANNYFRIVVTYLPTPEYNKRYPNLTISKDDFSGVTINSNIDGGFIRAFEYKDGNITEQIEGLIGNYGIADQNNTLRYSDSPVTKRLKAKSK